MVSGTPTTAAEVAAQRDYYRQTAGAYDAMHEGNDPEHEVALAFLARYLLGAGCRSVLDVGAGTGRVVAYFGRHAPALSVVSLEPVRDLLLAGRARGKLPSGSAVQGSGVCLPFADRSFDAVIETATLHHLERPGAMVAEMLRVARVAIGISDANRFGQGHLPARFAKLALYRLGLWRLARRVQHGGKLYAVSDGDGVAYSYSVFDSLPAIAARASEVVILPTRGGVRALTCPLLLAPHVALAAHLHNSSR